MCFDTKSRNLCAERRNGRDEPSAAAAGNLASDSHKGLLFSYNLANLPSKVEGVGYNAGLTYSYGYLSDGTKTSADCGSGSTALGLRYRGSFVYETVGSVERLQSIPWPEGRIVLEYDGDDTEPCLVSYDWLVTDHLGSVRAIAGMRTGSTGVKEVNGYLPFGTRLPGTLQSSGNRHRFGGKEEQRIGSTDLKLLDFGARYYDAFACRWTTLDPMAGKYPAITPYSYCAGDPVNLVDSLGKSIGLPVKAFKVAKRVLKTSGTVKRVSTAALLTAEVYGYYDDIVTLTSSESSLAEKAVAGVDLVTGFGNEFKSGVHLLGIKSFAQGNLRSFTKWNFRHNLGQLTGGIQEGKEAHHILPQQFEYRFNNCGINIHDPKYGAWLDSYGHHKTHKEYNNAWQVFFDKNEKPTIEQIESFAQQLMAEIYGYNYTPTL